MTGKGWSWITLEKKRGVQVEGWLFLQPHLPSQGMQLFKEQVSAYTKSSFNLTITPDSVDLTYSVALYNAIMLYARAATKVLSEGGDLHDGQAVTEAVRSTPFEGVGGNTVVLDKQGDRIESYDVMNFVVEADGGMGSVPVGLYNSSLGEYTAYERAVVWPGGTHQVPRDRMPPVFNLSQSVYLYSAESLKHMVMLQMICSVLSSWAFQFQEPWMSKMFGRDVRRWVHTLTKFVSQLSRGICSMM